MIFFYSYVKPFDFLTKILIFNFIEDVIGVMEEPEPLGRIYNRFGVQQSQLKFRLTDGM